MALTQRLLSQSSVIFAARIVGAAAIFGAQAAIARMWGTVQLGEYLLIMAAVGPIAAVLPLGFHMIGTFFTAEYAAKQDGEMLAHFLARCYAHVLVIGALCFTFLAPLAHLFGEPGVAIASYAPQLSLLAMAMATIFVNTTVLVGLRRPFSGYFPEILLRPITVVAGVGAATLFAVAGARIEWVIWAMAIGCGLIALGQFAIVIFSASRVPKAVATRAADTRRWWRFALPWALVTLATDFFFDLDILMLAGHMSREELAIFGVSTKIFSLISFGVAAVYAVTLPDMFEAEAKNDRLAFHARIGEANLIAAGVASILVLGVAIGGRFVLAIFGEAFAVGIWPLTILCIALLVRSVFGPASIVLSIHDKPFASLPAVGTGLVSLYVLNYFLVPELGLLGAALAALASILVWSLGLWFTARLLLGVDVSILARLQFIKLAAQRPTP